MGARGMRFLFLRHRTAGSMLMQPRLDIAGTETMATPTLGNMSLTAAL